MKEYAEQERTKDYMIEGIKDTVIPVKFLKKLSVDEIVAFVDTVNEFAEVISTEMAFISFSAVKNRLDNNKE